MPNSPCGKKSNEERQDNMANNSKVDEDKTQPCASVAAAVPPGGFAPRPTERDTLEDQEDREDQAHIPSLYVGGCSGRLGEEETVGATENVSLKDWGEEDRTRAGASVGTAIPPGAFASRPTDRDAIEDQGGRVRASSSYDRGRRDRLGEEEEMDDGTEEVHLKDWKPAADPIRHGKKAAVLEKEGTNPKVKITASGAVKLEPTCIPETILGELPAHPLPDERAQREKPGKPVPEKLPPTSPDCRDEGGNPQAKHGDGMMRPSSRAVPEVVPAAGPAMDFLQAGHGHGIMRPPSGALPEIEPAPGPTMGPMNFSGSPSSIGGTGGYAAQAGLSRRPHPMGISPLFASEGDDEHQEGVVGGLQLQPSDGPRPTSTEAPGAYAVSGITSGDDDATNQGASQQGGGADGSIAYSAYLAPDDVAAEQQQEGRRPQRRDEGHIAIPREEGTVYEGVAVPARSSAGAPNTSWWKPLKKHRVVLAAATICAAVAGAIVPVAVFRHHSDAKLSDGAHVPIVTVTAAPASGQYVAIKRELQLLMNCTALALEDVTSPQHRALVWLADEDRRQVDLKDVLSLTQRFVLAMFFFMTGGEGSWIRDCNFLSSEHECYWNTEVPDSYDGVQGAFCSGDKATVDEIIIDKNNMTGELPEELCMLSSIKVLDLSFNNIAGSIPSSLGHLQQLTSLRLFENHLSGAVPSSLGGLIELDELYLDVNELEGPIPSSLGKLSKLKHLWLGCNNLTGTIPIELNNLNKLEVLFLRSNSLEGMLPVTAGGLPSLRKLGIGENTLSGTIPEALFTLRSLTVIDFWGNALMGTLSPEFSKLSRLEVLDVVLNFLSGTLPPSLMSLSQLRKLSLGVNAFTGTIPSEFGNLYKLQKLYLSGNRLGGTIPEAMGNLVELDDLQLDRNQFTGRVTRSFTKLKALRILRIDNNSITGDLEFLCNNSWAFFMADCHGDNSEVKCGCCSACCSDDLGYVGNVFGCFTNN